MSNIICAECKAKDGLENDGLEELNSEIRAIISNWETSTGKNFNDEVDAGTITPDDLSIPYYMEATCTECGITGNYDGQGILVE